MRAFVSLLLFGLCWSLAQYWIPATVHWRDSGEFLLTAAYLDISHPPGSPFFAMWANILSLLPAGHITWRITSGLSLTAILVLALLWKLCYELSFRIAPNISFLARHLCATLAPLILLGTNSFVKSLLTVEVYGLLTAFFLILALCCVYYEKTGDKRWILSACFVGGLGAGNHAVIGALVPAALPALLVGRFKELRNLIVPGLLLVIFGAAVYGYLPIRAQGNLPLNTGSPVSIDRFLAHITDARDTALRPAEQSSSAQSARSSISHNFSALLVNFDQLKQGLSLEVLVISALGLALLFIYSSRLALILILPMLIQAWLFAGWDSDPWLVLTAVLTIGSSMCAVRCITFVKDKKVQGLCCALFVVLLVGQVLRGVELGKGFNLRSFALTSDTAVATLAKLPSNAVFLNEQSWFILKYLQDIEGYRTDIQLVYQPSVLFPEYFNPAILASSANADSLNSANVNIKDSATAPEFQRLGSFIGYAAPRSRLFFEPNATINQFLSGIARCEDNPVFAIINLKTRQFKQRCLELAIQELLPLRAGANPALSLLAADTANYLESRLNGLADLLIKSDYKVEAISALEQICGPISSTPCSIITINNLIAFKMRAGDAEGARSIAEAVLKRGFGTLPDAFFQNLQLLGSH
ncbi:MAG: DUF2723 domain-containing protein [Oligoflexia bacterium]|nr:DUF2723 domain-containing protein [Oligoflexia bacterium]